MDGCISVLYGTDGRVGKTQVARKNFVEWRLHRASGLIERLIRQLDF